MLMVPVLVAGVEKCSAGFGFLCQACRIGIFGPFLADSHWWFGLTAQPKPSLKQNNSAKTVSGVMSTAPHRRLALTDWAKEFALVQGPSLQNQNALRLLRVFVQ